jgi:hypothetical protein
MNLNLCLRKTSGVCLFVFLFVCASMNAQTNKTKVKEVGKTAGVQPKQEVKPKEKTTEVQNEKKEIPEVTDALINVKDEKKYLEEKKRAAKKVEEIKK